MARTPPGKTRARILAFVERALEEGRPPSIREVQQAVGLNSPEAARLHLLQLVDEGRLAKEEGARGWRLPGDAATEVRFVPLLGEVPAGDPTEAVEEREGVVPVDARRIRGSSHKLFALRVRGESMRDAGILPRDVVIVDPRARVGHKDIVVARIDAEATVKRLWIAKGRAELRPENPAFEPIVPAEGEELAILGKVIEVRRYLPA
jgi:repressor LexA